MTSPKELFRRLFVRSRFFRHVARWAIRDKRSPLDFSHILAIRENAPGPVHRDEALILFALTRVLCPQTIVEFGFALGQSALSFLLAADSDCRVFSYDYSKSAAETATKCFGHFKNLRLIAKSQTDFSSEDIENRKIDLCFLDASHDLAHNLKTFELIQPSLSETAIVAVHDTGTWQRKFFTSRHHAFPTSDFGRKFGRWLDAEQFQPSAEDRLFVNHLLSHNPNFSQIHLHSANTLRNGITLLQKSVPLATNSVPHE
jgi:hypothetical protein